MRNMQDASSAEDIEDRKEYAEKRCEVPEPVECTALSIF